MLISKFGSIEADTISEYEDKISVVLPKKYKTFIEKYNGGETPNTSFMIGGIRSDIKGFYGIGNVKFSFDTIRTIEIEGRCYLPIAFDSFGNDILLETKEGTIHFRNHENGSLELLGSDFEEFIEKCESKPIDKSAVKSVEEREKELIARGRGEVITDALRDMWRVEINKFSAMSQVEVTI